MDQPRTPGVTGAPRLERGGELHADRPVGELVKDLSGQTQTLVRQALELALHGLPPQTGSARDGAHRAHDGTARGDRGASGRVRHGACGA